MRFATKKKTKEREQADEEANEKKDNMNTFFDSLAKNLSTPPLRAIGIYGDINEEKCSEAVYALLQLDNDRPLVPEDPEDPDSDLVEVIEPIDFYVSSHGGVAVDMFSVYDIIRKVKQRTPIRTIGLGKVMSAGVLLLASGTKGERRIGKNCRVMIHGVISGQHGHLHDVENEFEEAKLTQKQYIQALADETDMTVNYIRKLINRKTNVYIDAKKAVELGIADIVF